MCDQISPTSVLSFPFLSPCLAKEIQTVNPGKKVLNVAQEKKTVSWKAMGIENCFLIAWSERAVLKNNNICTR